jgi:N-carbamoyl-L-amino-acid hydrolase
MVGSHIDTVATGGLYDGNLGVLAGLEIVEVLNDAGIRTRHPIAVAFFTNEEGARFTPDMMGSAVHQGSLSLEEALVQTDADGISVGDELARNGYVGEHPVGEVRARAFLELHIEQGPVLEREGITIGAVTGVQGISWTEWTIGGSSNHAGTTPMSMRADAGLVAASIAVEARAIAHDFGGDQVATVGLLNLEPNLVNVIARRAQMTVDLRNTDWTILEAAEKRMREKAEAIAANENCSLESRTLVHFEPVEFDDAMVGLVEETAQSLGHSVRRMPSGAGHDAQMFAPNCPTAMIFVPSKDGLSHNVKEYTAPDELRAGADVLLQCVLQLAEPIGGER